MKEKRTSQRSILFGALIGAVVFLFPIGLLLFQQNKLLKNQVEYQRQNVALLESVQKADYGSLLGNILNKVDDELSKSPTKTLSNETIARIADLSYSFKPKRLLEGDDLSSNELSPERGQLLMALSKMDMDSTSFFKIKYKTTFAFADLSGVNLSGVNLQGIDLEGANLKEADLRKVNLENANLKGANLWGANLNKAKMNGANLKKADLGWAELNEVDLREARLNLAIFENAKLRKADLRNSIAKSIDFTGAFLNDANLEGADLFWAVFRKSNLTNTNLSGSDLKASNLKDAHLTGVNLSNVRLIKVEVSEADWLEKLSEWQVIGAEKIQKEYKVVKQTSGSSNYILE